MAGDSKGKQTRFEMIIGAVDDFSKVFKGFNDRVGKSSAQVDRMRKSVEGLNRATGFTRLANSAQNVAGSMRNVASEGKTLVSTVSGFAAKASLLFGGAGAGFTALARGTANAGDAAAKAASRAGVGLRTWQEYAHAANLSGVSSEELEKNLSKLQAVAVKAFQGDKTQKSLLKLAGIDPKTAQGEVKNADSVLTELAEKVRALQESGQGAKATNLVKSILGDEGTRLMPMLLGGADGLRKMRLEAHKLGLVFSKEDAAASEDFNDGITRMQASLKGIGFTVGRQLMPPITKLMGKFTEWAAKQREIIGAKFAEWIEKLDVDALWGSIERGIGTLGDLAKKADGLAQAFGGWENVAIALAALISGKFLLSIASLAASFGKLGLAVMTTPFGWFLGGVALVAGSVYAVYKNWDGITSYFAGLWQGVKDAFARNWVEGVLTFLANFNPVRLVAKGMNELIAYFTGFDMLTIGAGWVDGIKNGIMGKWDGTVAWFKEQVNALTGWMPDWVREKLGFGQPATESGSSTRAEAAAAMAGNFDLTGMSALNDKANLGIEQPVTESGPRAEAATVMAGNFDLTGLSALNDKAKLGIGQPAAESGQPRRAEAATTLSGNFNLKSMSALNEKVSEVFSSFTGSLKNFFGFGSGESGSGSGSAPSLAMAAPLNLGPAAKNISETRTEHVEKNDLTIQIQAENGATAKVSGSTGPGVNVSQNGQLAMGMF